MSSLLRLLEMLFRALPALVALALASCATIPEEQCPKVDWYALGLADGRDGAPAARLADHRKACAGVNVEPDERAWLEGRRAGLVEYCRLPGAVSAGLAGRGYAGVCPDPRFVRLYAAARQVFDARAKVSEIDRDLASARRDIADPNTSDIRRDILRGQVRSLENDRRRAVDRLRDAETELQGLRRASGV